MLLHSINTKPEQTLYNAAEQFADKVFPPDLESLLELHKTMMVIRPAASSQTSAVIDYPCSFHTGIKAILYMLPLLDVNCWMIQMRQNPRIVTDFILELCASGYNLIFNCQVANNAGDRDGDGHVVYFDSSNGTKDHQFALSDPNYPDPLLFSRSKFESWLSKETPYTCKRRIKFAGIVYGFQ